MSDPISDMIVRIKNAQKSLLISVDVPYSLQKTHVLDVLKEEGYIKNYSIEDVRKGIKNISISLKYSKLGRPAIDVIQKVSKPGSRVYSSSALLKPFFNGMGIYILSTSSKGVVSDRVARKARIGGEVICRVF